MIARLVRFYLSSRALRGIAAALLVIAVTLTMLGTPWESPLIPYRMDLEVYWLGGQLLREGGDLYGQLPPLSEGSHLPFTYPPLAAMLFAPLSMVSLTPATVIHTLGTVAGLALVVGAVLHRMGAGRDRTRDLVWLTVALTTLGLATGPLRETVGYGQVNVLLMALVVVDCLYGRGRWWGGALVGLAAAIKLTPATMIVYFVVRGDWRSLCTAIVSAAGFTGLAHLVAPDESTRYWTSTLSDPARIGGLEFASNQSINGVVHRLGFDGDSATLLWFCVSAVLGLTISFAAWLLVRRGQDVGAAVLVAFIALVCSPVSWGHHWVWAVPMLIVLGCWSARSRDRVWLGLAASGLFVFLSTPQWWGRHNYGLEFEWTVAEHVIGNAYLVWTLVLLAVVIHRALRTAPGGLPSFDPSTRTRAGVSRRLAEPQHHDSRAVSRPGARLWDPMGEFHRSP